MITYQAENQRFTLETENTRYIFEILYEKYLVHLYYGAKNEAAAVYDACRTAGSDCDADVQFVSIRSYRDFLCGDDDSIRLWRPL